MDLLKQEGHVCGQRPHGLHTLGVELHLALTAVLMTTAAVDAHADGLAANLNDLRLHAMLLQRRLNLLQAAERVAVGARAAVN